MQPAISETQRRRKIQLEYNTEHGIDPQTIRKKVSDILLSLGRRHGTAPTPKKERASVPRIPRCPPRSWGG